MYKINKNIPIPNNRHQNTKYPFIEMEVGDSFLYTGKKENIYAAASTCKKRHGIVFRCIREGENIRVWRVE